MTINGTESDLASTAYQGFQPQIWEYNISPTDVNFLGNKLAHLHEVILRRKAIDLKNLVHFKPDHKKLD
jgi:hypothetical protein